MCIPQDGGGYSLCRVTDWQQLGAWLQAASASLQLLPQLVAWHGAWWHAPDAARPGHPGAAGLLAGQLLCSMWCSGPWKALGFLVPSGPRPGPGSAASQLGAHAAAGLAAQAFRLQQLGGALAHYAAANQAAVADVLGGGLEPGWAALSGLAPQWTVLEQLLARSGAGHPGNRWAGCDAAACTAPC